MQLGRAGLPDVGDLALDTKQNRLGIVMDAQGGRYFLRRPEGGREWEACPDDVRPASAPEETWADARESRPRQGGAVRRAR